jgi:chemotaxis-related protein WspD
MNRAASDEPTPLHSDIDDCWNRIGVQGDLSCPALAQHIHCRNCPVYSAAAAVLLDREMSQSHVEERTVQYAQQRQDLAPGSRSIAIFRLGAEWLGLPTGVVVEVVGPRTIHSLPHRRGGVVLGLVNVRGELLICVSLGQLLGIEPAASQGAEAAGDASQRLLVVRGDGGRLAFPVDEMHGIHRYDPGELQAAPVTIQKAGSRHVAAMLAWNGASVGCLDEQLVMHAWNRSLA